MSFLPPALWSGLIITLIVNTVHVDSSASSTPLRHVLLLMSDSHDGRTVDPTDDVVFPAQRLPSIRSLADRGINFVRTYAHSPQCTPSRASMYTGRRTDQIRVYNNGFGLARDHATGGISDSCASYFPKRFCEERAVAQNTTSTFKETLEAAGINVTIFGKTHVGANIVAEGPPGFDAPASTLSTLARAARVLKPSGDWLLDDDRHVANETDPLPPWRYNGKTHKDPKTLAACLDVLSRLPTDGDVAQLVHCSFFSPHPPFDSNATFLERIDPQKVQLPPALDVTHPEDVLASVQKLHLDYVVNGTETRKVRYTDRQIQEVRRVYYAMGAQLDDWIGQIVSTLDMRSDAASWFVVYVSDHGEMQMEHRQTGKNSMFEASVRVPLAIAGPGIAPRQSTALVSLLDIFPTLCDLLDVPIPTFVSGQSLAPLLFDGSKVADEAHRACVFAQYHSLYSSTGQYMVRCADDYKLIAYANTSLPSRLYSLANDPAESKNLRDTEPAVAARMLRALDDAWDWRAADREARDFQRSIFREFVWSTNYNATGGCFRAFDGVAFRDFDKGDMSRIASWSGLPCR